MHYTKAILDLACCISLFSFIPVFPCNRHFFIGFSLAFNCIKTFLLIGFRCHNLKLCNRRHCPFVALILIVSLPFLNAVALLHSDFSFLFSMTMSLTTCPVSVIGHLSTLPLRAGKIRSPSRHLRQKKYFWRPHHELRWSIWRLTFRLKGPVWRPQLRWVPCANKRYCIATGKERQVSKN